MDTPRIYLYNKCSTCRKATQFLKSNNIEFDAIAIREQPPTVIELKFMLSQYNGEIRKLFNTSGQDYRNGNYKDKLMTMSTNEALDELSKNGNLVKRPFLISDSYGIVGFKIAEWEALSLIGN